MNKKKDLKLIEYKDQSRWSLYHQAGFMFAFCSEVDVDNRVRQLTVFEGCREGLVCRIFDRATYRIPTTSIRCLIRTIVVKNSGKGREMFEKQTDAGLRILNIMERHSGWPLTKMLNVETREIPPVNNDGKRAIFMRMLEGSDKWMKSPHMLSLFFLLYRLSTRSSKYLTVKNYKQFKEVCKEYSAGSATSGDKHNVRNTILFWDTLMNDFDKMFKGLTARSNFDKRNYTDTYYNEGISKLCSFQTANIKIDERFVALACEVGAKVPKNKRKQFGF